MQLRDILTGLAAGEFKQGDQFQFNGNRVHILSTDKFLITFKSGRREVWERSKFPARSRSGGKPAG
jgi:hypothetical protein